MSTGTIGLRTSQLYKRSLGVELERMGGETVLLNVETSKFCLLNPTAAFLWERLKEPVTTSHLVTEIRHSFSGCPLDGVAEDVESVVAELAANGFVVSMQQE